MLILAECMNHYGFRPRGIVHAGAHYAQEMDEYLALQPDLIVWIEGDPAHVPDLDRIIASRVNRATRQIVIEALITDHDGGVVDFHRFSNNGASSSIFRGTDLLRQTWPGLDETGETVALRAWRLATVLEARGLVPAQIDVLVFDLQGAELLALNGAGAFLEAASFVEVETSLCEFYTGGVMASELDIFLTGRGFQRITEFQLHGDTVYRRNPI